MKTIRAKFRCLSVEHRWSGETFVKLGPVKRTGKDKENDLFWKYTPNGEAEATFPRGAVVPFTAGDYYYVDFQKDDGGVWRMTGLDHQDYAVIITLTARTDAVLGCDWGSVKMGLSIEATGAREELQPHGSTWNVRFSHAEPNDLV